MDIIDGIRYKNSENECQMTFRSMHLEKPWLICYLNL